MKNIDKTEIRLYPICLITNLDTVLKTLEAETTIKLFLRCYFYNANQVTHVKYLKCILISLSTASDNILINILLYGDDKFNDLKNREILMSAIH